MLFFMPILLINKCSHHAGANPAFSFLIPAALRLQNTHHCGLLRPDHARSTTEGNDGVLPSDCWSVFAAPISARIFYTPMGCADWV